jgi:hypothetical protein
MANSTATQIITDAEGITKIDSSSIGLAGLEETMLLRIIDKANREYYSKFQVGGGEPKSDRTAETGGTIVAGTTLNGAITFASTSIVLDSVTGFSSSGAGIVWDNEDPDFIEYTSIASLTLNGVTGIGYNHEDADAFSVLYALPANFESFRSVDDSDFGVSVDGIPYKFVTGIPVDNEFSVYDNGTTKYLFFPKDLTGDYSVRYNKGATSITATSTTIDVPISDEDFVIFRLVEHIYRVLNVDYNKVVEARQIADSCLLNSLKRRNVGRRLKMGRVWGVRSSSPFPSSVIAESL